MTDKYILEQKQKLIDETKRRFTGTELERLASKLGISKKKLINTWYWDEIDTKLTTWDLRDKPLSVCIQLIGYGTDFPIKYKNNSELAAVRKALKKVEQIFNSPLNLGNGCPKLKFKIKADKYIEDIGRNEKYAEFIRKIFPQGYLTKEGSKLHERQWKRLENTKLLGFEPKCINVFMHPAETLFPGRSTRGFVNNSFGLTVLSIRGMAEVMEKFGHEKRYSTFGLPWLLAHELGHAMGLRHFGSTAKDPFGGEKKLPIRTI